jgi:hypothetical protein
VEVTSGNQLRLELQYTSVTGYSRCYVQVEGASDYFEIAGSSNDAESGTIIIPIEVPPEVDTGDFFAYSCIVGANGSVSNPVRTTVNVTNPEPLAPVGGGGEICSPYGTTACGLSLSYCVVGAAQSCYYVVGGQRFDCASCTSGSDVQACAQRATDYALGFCQ